jgi:2-oxoglutarate ferredoxin oxidoreductase subunit beta
MTEQIQMVEDHPLDYLLRKDRLPHVWCAGCGLGSVVNSYLHALEELKIDPDTVAVVSGIGCTGRFSGYINTDSFHTTHGRAIPFAIGLKLANPNGLVSVISGDGDLMAIGGNHIIHAARRNVDLLVICVNNFNYGMTGGQGGPTTPFDAWTTTTQLGNIEPAFNLVDLIASAGAPYVARWTSLDVVRLTHTIKEAMLKKGFRFIEVISPCPTTFGRRNNYREGIKMLDMFNEITEIDHGRNTKDTALPSIGSKPMIEGEDILWVGKFVDNADNTTSYLERIRHLQDIGKERSK